MGSVAGLSWEARHYDSGVLYMECVGNHDTKTWCFYSHRGGTFVGQVGYPWIEPNEPWLTVPVSQEHFERRMKDASSG